MAKGRVLAAKSSWAGVESEDKFRAAWKSDEGAVPSAEEADRAWNASLVPASIHATTRYRKDYRRRVMLGGCGELEMSLESGKQRSESFSKV